MTQFEPLQIITFDLETKLDVKAVGGWGAAQAGKAGCSILVTHDSLAGDYAFYDEHTLDQFAALVEQPGVVVAGFNSKWFDVPVVQGILGRRLAIRHHVDIFDMIKDALDREGRTRERGWTLGDASLRAMGITKSGSGAFASVLVEQGRIAELVTYCRHDVDLTRQLLDYIRRHGGVADRDGSLLELDVPAWLRLPPQSALEG